MLCHAAAPIVSTGTATLRLRRRSDFLYQPSPVSLLEDSRPCLLEDYTVKCRARDPILPTGFTNDCIQGCHAESGQGIFIQLLVDWLSGPFAMVEYKSRSAMASRRKSEQRPDPPAAYRFYGRAKRLAGPSRERGVSRECWPRAV